MLTQQRVLLIDCDPRGHASLALGVDMQHVRYSVTDLLTGAKPDVQALCWHPGANLHILPAHATLTDIEPELVRCGDGRLRLKQALHPLLDSLFTTPRLRPGPPARNAARTQRSLSAPRKAAPSFAVNASKAGGLRPRHKGSAVVTCGAEPALSAIDAALARGF